MSQTINPYKILNLEKDCSLEEINSAYRKLSKMYHPDMENRDE